MSTIEKLTEQLMAAKKMNYVVDIKLSTSECSFGYVLHVSFDSLRVNTPTLNRIIEHISTAYEPVCGVVLCNSIADDTIRLKIVVKERPIGYQLACI
jgi:GTP:adenosylcobinamide-phosphate guanylyltransferase